MADEDGRAFNRSSDRFDAAQGARGRPATVATGRQDRAASNCFGCSPSTTSTSWPLKAAELDIQLRRGQLPPAPPERIQGSAQRERAGAHVAKGHVE